MSENDNDSDFADLLGAQEVAREKPNHATLNQDANLLTQVSEPNQGDVRLTRENALGHDSARLVGSEHSGVPGGSDSHHPRGVLEHENAPTPPAEKPVAILLQESGSGRWRIDLQTLPAFRAAIGNDVVRDFACCFVHADRLLSLTSFFRLNRANYGEDSIVFRRNFETVVWFSVGTLRELALSIRALRSSLAKRGLLNANEPAWTALRALENRWDKDPLFREMRNKVAFHVDKDTMEAGLSRPAAAGDVTLVQGDGGTGDDISIRLGTESLVMGTGVALDQFDAFFAAASRDHNVANMIQAAFIDVAQRAGITLVTPAD
jgi:hypothetical protein